MIKYPKVQKVVVYGRKWPHYKPLSSKKEKQSVAYI